MRSIQINMLLIFVNVLSLFRSYRHHTANFCTILKLKFEYSLLFYNFLADKIFHYFILLFGDAY